MGYYMRFLVVGQPVTFADLVEAFGPDRNAYTLEGDDAQTVVLFRGALACDITVRPAKPAQTRPRPTGPTPQPRHRRADREQLVGRQAGEASSDPTSTHRANTAAAAPESRASAALTRPALRSFSRSPVRPA